MTDLHVTINSIPLISIELALTVKSTISLGILIDEKYLVKIPY